MRLTAATHSPFLLMTAKKELIIERCQSEARTPLCNRVRRERISLATSSGAAVSMPYGSRAVVILFGPVMDQAFALWGR